MSPYVYASNFKVQLGSKPTSDKALRFFEDENGPKGIMNVLGPDESGDVHYERVYESKELGLKSKGSIERPAPNTSMRLSGGLRVENFPKQGLNLYEWYVPTMEDKYEYWELITFPYVNEEEKAEAVDRFENYYKQAVFFDFNNDDLWARDAMQPFYENGVGFDEEKPGTMDAVIVNWRKLVSRHARGIQSPPKELGRKR